MRITCWRWLAPGFLLLALCAGCNMMSLPYFLLAPEPTAEPALGKVAADEKKKEIKLAILTYLTCDITRETLSADQELSDMLAVELKKDFEYNEENVKVIKPHKVREYINQHPAWKDMPLEEIGKELEVDYVFYLEIQTLELYKKGSFKDLYQGHLLVNASLANVGHPDDSPHPKLFDCTYPSESKGGAISVDVGSGPQLFREQFLKHAAKKLAWYIVTHPTHDDQMVDD